MLYIFIVIAIVSMYVIYHYSGYLNIIGKRKNKNKNIFLCIVIFLICTYFLVVLIDFSLYSVNVPLFCFYGIIIISALLKRLIFSYMPKKSREIYDCIFVHRGFHFQVPENTLAAYGPVLGKFGIEMDVRYLKRDHNIICFHDRYTSRLLGVPGKVSNYTYDELWQNKYKGSNIRVVKLQKALKQIACRSVLLIEVKGYMTKGYKLEFERILKKYNGKVYFHCKNIITYYKLTRMYPKRVFWVLNPFRKRFNFLKGKHYNGIFDRFIGLFEEASIEVPSLEDISQVLVDAIEDNKSVKEICATISGVLNNYTSRIDKNHWLLNSLKIHRGIVSDRYPENSLKSIEACIKFAKYTNTRVALELDLVYYNKQVVCYHSDKVSNKLGQEQSCAEKIDLKEAVTLYDVLKLAVDSDCYDLVSFMFDFKDFHYKNRILEKEFIRLIDETCYRGNFSVQAWNPLVLMYFEKVRPEYIRGQVGHSLSGLIKYVPLNGLPWVVNVLLFNRSHADFCAYDASNYIYVLIKYNKDIKGRPVFIYAPKSEQEIKSFIGREQIAGFIIENPLNPKAWSKRYIRKFKKKDN